MIHLIADYKDPHGQYLHRVYQASGTDDPRDALSAVVYSLSSSGFLPCAVALIPGKYTLQELEQIAEKGTVPKGYRFLYLNRKECFKRNYVS